MISLMLVSLASTSQGLPSFDVLSLDPRGPVAANYPVRLLSPSDLNANAVTDFVHLTPAEVHAAIDPSVVDAPVTASLSATAATARPDGDGVYIANARGLEYATHSGMPWTWSWTSVIADGDWTNAQSLEFFDVDGQGGSDLLGISSDGYGILLATDSGSGLQGAATALATTAGTIDDVIAYRYDLTRAAMIVASTSVGLECFWVTGGSVSTVPMPTPNGRLAVLREPGAADRFAWLRNRGVDRRLEISTLPGQVESFLALPGWLTSMASGNYDNDDYADLIFGGAPEVNGERAVQVKVLRQTPSRTFSTDVNNARDFTFDDRNGLEEYEPFMGDADGDGDGDVVVAAPNGALYLAFSDVVSRDEVTPWVLETIPAGDPTDRDEHLWVPVPENSQDDHRLHVRVDALPLPPTVEKDGATVTATHIEWIIWESVQSWDENLEAEYETAPLPLDHGYFRLDGSDTVVSTHPMLTNRPFYLVGSDIFEETTVGTDIRYLTLRYVAYDNATSLPLVRWPARQQYLVSTSNPVGIAYAESLPFTPDVSEYIFLHDPVEDPAAAGGSGSGSSPTTASGGETTSGGSSDCTPDFGDDCGPPGTPPPGN